MAKKFMNRKQLAKEIFKPPKVNVKVKAKLILRRANKTSLA